LHAHWATHPHQCLREILRNWPVTLCEEDHPLGQVDGLKEDLWGRADRNIIARTAKSHVDESLFAKKEIILNIKNLAFFRR
jgi:hypothetical protein